MHRERVGIPGRWRDRATSGQPAASGIPAPGAAARAAGRGRARRARAQRGPTSAASGRSPTAALAAHAKRRTQQGKGQQTGRARCARPRARGRERSDRPGARQSRATAQPRRGATRQHGAPRTVIADKLKGAPLCATVSDRRERTARTAFANSATVGEARPKHYCAKAHLLRIKGWGGCQGGAGGRPPGRQDDRKPPRA